jgi:hypothetical protein
MNTIITSSSDELVSPQSLRVLGFLERVGLPSDNILAPQAELDLIGKNLPDLIANLPAAVKKDARYLSKFVIGAGIGLFDYALNAIWNEVVLDLHKKVVGYGLDIFYDAAVGGKRREFYQTEDDLRSLKDAVLLDSCFKLELISELTHKKLKHILDMRNDIGISHPTNYSINAFELLGWLQTCVQDVLNDRPTEAALQVQAFIANLRNHTQPLDAVSQAGIVKKISALPSHHCGNILRTMFGLYVAPETDPQVRKNISLLAVSVWGSASDDVKYRLGLTLEGYRSNLYQERYDLGEQFFKTVNGNAYRSNAERSIIVDGLLDLLLEKHNGWDNFHHEAPVADELAGFIQSQGDILPNFAGKLVKNVLMCRVGRGITYNNGVSPRGKDYYDRIISLFGDKYAVAMFIALASYELQNKLSGAVGRAQACLALGILKDGLADLRLQECAEFLLQQIPAAGGKALFDDRFKKLSAGYITWK